MKITEIDKDLIVKIGAEEGIGYFYVGRMGDIDLEAINNTLIDDCKKAYASNLRIIRTKPEEKIGRQVVAKFVKSWKAYTEWKPIEERKIVDMFESVAEPNVTAVILEGGGKGPHWMLDESQPIKLNSDKAALELLGAAYKPLCEALEKHYVEIYTTKDPAELNIAVSHALALEEQVTTGISRMTRMNAVKAICFDEDGNQINDPKKVDEAILTAMHRCQ